MYQKNLQNQRYASLRQSSVSARACFDPVNSSVDAMNISECVFHDTTKLPPLKCLKNPVSTLLSVKRERDISVLKYCTGIIDFFHPIALF